MKPKNLNQSITRLVAYLARSDGRDLLKGMGLAVILLFVGCSTAPVVQQHDELRLLLGEITAREQVLDKRQALLAERGSLLAKLELKQETAAEQSTLIAEPNAGSLNATFLPAPSARLGQCFRLTRLPPRLSAEPQTVVVRDAADKIEITPALFAPETFDVVVDYELPSAINAPVAMRTRTEVIELKPAYETWTAIPASFNEQQDLLLAAPAHHDFKPCGQVAAAEGMSAQWCPISVAAEYQTVVRRVVEQLSDVRHSAVAAETVSVEISEPENAVLKQQLRPITRSFTRQRLLQEASYRREVLLPEFKTITAKQLTRPAALAWREVVCAEQDRQPLLEALQNALNKRGYEAGVADGAWGEKTAAALEKFRRDKGLPELGTDIGIELLRQLEVGLP